MAARFMAVSGDAPLSRGVFGVSIDGGTEDVIALRADERFSTENAFGTTDKDLTDVQRKIRGKVAKAYSYLTLCHG